MPIDTQGDRLEHGRCADKSFSYRRRNMVGCCFGVERKTNYGIVESDRVIQDSGSPLGENAVTNNIHSLEQVKLLAPIKPAMLYSANPNVGVQR